MQFPDPSPFYWRQEKYEREAQEAEEAQAQVPGHGGQLGGGTGGSGCLIDGVSSRLHPGYIQAKGGAALALPTLTLLLTVLTLTVKHEDFF